MNTNINDLTNLKILYAEDEAEAREGLYKYLKRRVGKVYAVADGLEGISAFKEYRPDIVIVDLYMPNTDGIEMVKEIRKLDDNCQIIVTSAVSDVETILKSVDVGINKYLIKPIDREELLDALADAASKISRQKSHTSIIHAEQKKRLENEIKKEFTLFLKTTTGKGPRDVVVFIHENLIEVTAYDTLTIMEKNMIDNNHNRAIIEQNRKLFYSIKEKVICKMLYDILQINAQTNQVEINVEKGTDKIVFTIV